MTPQQELEQELTKLQVVFVRRIREKLEADTVTPAMLDVARKVLIDLLPAPGQVPKAPPITDSLPFVVPEA